jgi:hypothetical protein
MKKIIACLLIVAMAAFGVVALPAENAAAEGTASCSTHFLGLRAWYDNLTEDGTCKIRKIKQDADGSDLRAFIFTAVMNVVSMVLGIVGYLAIAMVIWGGFQYMLAQGDAAKLARGKKTVTNAVIGMAIVMTASLISGAISDVISNAKSGDFIMELLNTAFVWGGIIAVVMMIWGGIQYVTSAGNPTAAKKGRDTILYSAVGLLIVILAAVIVNTVVGAIAE